VRAGGNFVELPIARKLPRWRRGAPVSCGREHFPEWIASRIATLTFDRKLQLAGLSMLRTPDRLEVKYRWRYLQPPGREYWCFTHIVDRQGQRSPDTSTIRFPKALKSGSFVSLKRRREKSYSLRLGVFDRASGQRLTIHLKRFPAHQCEHRRNREVIYSWLTSFHVLSGLNRAICRAQRGGVGSQILLVENALVTDDERFALRTRHIRRAMPPRAKPPIMDPFTI